MAEATGRNNMNPFKIVLGLLELWMVAIVLILGIAFIMGLLGANPDAAFAEWIYSRTDDIMAPFAGIFDPIELTGETEIQTSLLFAMAIYAAIAAILRGISQRFA